MVQYVVTPWRNREELLQVRGQLYPQSSVSATKKESQKQELEDKGFAVAKVSVWMQRGNCPHLVESTAILTGAVLNDVPGNSTYCVRAAYAAAFCRWVTYFGTPRKLWDTQANSTTDLLQASLTVTKTSVVNSACTRLQRLLASQQRMLSFDTKQLMRNYLLFPSLEQARRRHCSGFGITIGLH